MLLDAMGEVDVLTPLLCLESGQGPFRTCWRMHPALLVAWPFGEPVEWLGGKVRSNESEIRAKQGSRSNRRLEHST